MATLEERIIARDATIAVLGLGYVGLPLAVEFAESGFMVSGVDLDVQKVATLNAGGSYVADVPAERVAPLVRRERLRAVTDYAQACRPGDGTRRPDVIFICVPTPYTGAKVPDLSYIEAAARSIAAHLVREQLVVLESTTYPGTTEELVQPLLERSGLSADRDFYLAFSPERINPGDRHFGVHNTPKVVGGTRPAATRLAKALFEAATPGPGVGGHCIPVDPFYLSWKAREYDFYTRFIEHAAAINESMPFHLYNLVAAALNLQGVAVPNARVLVLGVAFKPNVDDYRNSPVRRVIELLREHGAQVRYHDPHVPVFPIGGHLFAPEADGATLHSVELSEDELRMSDAVVIAIGHDGIDYDRVVQHAPLVVDAVNATRGCTHGRTRIRRLGAPPG